MTSYSYFKLLFHIDEDDWNIVIDECSSLNSKWKEISGFLSLRHSLIDSIKQDNPNNSSGCLNDALKQWIMQSYNTERFNKPSWRTLLTAVAKVDKLLFKRLANKYLLVGKLVTDSSVHMHVSY